VRGALGTVRSMGELDGLWNVKRSGGLLPPLIGVHKRIEGERGETRIGALVGVPFVVHGLELHYRGPFRSFVDRLEPDGSDAYRGTALVRGHAFGTFRMTRIGRGGATA
jgi:hypothetical protein